MTTKTVITVSELLKLPLSCRNWEDQKRIVAGGKPRPRLEWPKIDPTGPPVTFSETIYDQVSWLTGCETENKFFCWPCLLFNKKIKSWNRYGIALRNTESLLENLSKHEITEKHMQASLDLQLSVMKYVDGASLGQKSSDQGRNDIVTRKSLNLLIDVVCNGIAKRLPSRKGNNSNQLESEDCVKMLQLLQIYETCSSKDIDCAISLIRDNPKFLNDVVDSITEVIKNSIKSEVQASTYVSLILSEHYEIADKSLVSTVLRYLRNGRVCERFIGFKNLQEHGVSRLVVYEHISNVLADYGVSDSFLAYAFDGIMPLPGITNLVSTLKRNHGQIYFVPWYAHGLEDILYRSLSYCTVYNYFFTTLIAIRNFILEYDGRWQAFDQYRAQYIPDLTEEHFIESEVLHVISTYRKHFIGFFDSMLQNCKSWEPVDIAKASGFQQYLKEFETVFFLYAFSKLFEIISPFSMILKCKNSEQVFINFRLQELQNRLTTAQKNGFKEIWSTVLKEMGGENPNSVEPKLKCELRKMTEYCGHFQDIVVRLKQVIGIRFKKVHLLEFISLLQYHNVVKRSNVERLLEKLHKTQRSHFEREELINEIQVLKITFSKIYNLSTEDLFAFFHKADLKHRFKCIYRLAELSMALPSKRNLNDCGVSKLKKIKNWAHTQYVGVSGDISIIALELDYLRELRNSTYFNDQVIAKLCQVNKIGIV